MAFLDLFRKWKHPEPAIRLAAVEKLTDQVVLAEIAKTDEDNHVRIAAVKKLTDQVVLAEIAKTDKDQSVREFAVETLTDQAVLAEIAETDNTLRYEAIRSLATIGNIQAAPILANALESYYFNLDLVRKLSSRLVYLGRLDDVTIPAISRMLRSDTDETRYKAGLILEDIGTAAAMEALLANLTTEAGDVEFSVVSNLRDVARTHREHRQRIIEILFQTWAKHGFETYKGIAEALGRIGDIAVFSALKQALQTSSSNDRGQAVAGLAVLIQHWREDEQHAIKVIRKGLEREYKLPEVIRALSLASGDSPLSDVIAFVELRQVIRESEGVHSVVGNHPINIDGSTETELKSIIEDVFDVLAKNRRAQQNLGLSLLAEIGAMDSTIRNKAEVAAGMAAKAIESMEPSDDIGLRRISKSEQINLAKDQKTTPDTLAKLALSDFIEVAIAVAENPSSLPDTLECLNQRHNILGKRLYWQFVRNPGCPNRILQEIVSLCDNSTTVQLARKHPNFNE